VTAITVSVHAWPYPRRRKLGVTTMSDPIEYLARAQDCLIKAVHAPNQELARCSGQLATYGS
jgi:hypothetical protein